MIKVRKKIKAERRKNKKKKEDITSVVSFLFLRKTGFCIEKKRKANQASPQLILSIAKFIKSSKATS